MEDVFEVLATDHEEIRQVLAELEKGPTAATGACEDQLMLRKMMTEELIVEEAKHDEIERTELWPAVREHVPGGGQLADRAICQQLEIGELLAELDRLDASDPEFEEFLTAFTRAGRDHFDFEERHVWPRLRAVLTMKAASELGRKILRGRQAAAELPHPRASASPGGTHYGSFG
jgi:hemerythrin-like domain-containing protein